MQPTIVANNHDKTGEGPLWHPDEKVLYWTDIPDGNVYRYNPADGSNTCVFDGHGDVVGGMTLQADGSLLFFMARGAIRVFRAGRIVSTIVEFIAKEDDGFRWNDVIADPEGRVYGGTLSNDGRTGRFYRIDLDGTVEEIFTGVGCSNGMGFTADLRHLYFTDTTPGHIYRFDYERTTGLLCNQRLVVEVPKSIGWPDGMTIDSAGTLWSANWGGGCILKFAPDGTPLGKIDFPTSCISCLTYGGPDLRDVYVTTAGGDTAKSDAAAGALFHYRADVPGVPEFRSRIRLG